LNELGIIDLPTNFKLKDTPTPKVVKKKTAKVLPKAKAQGALAKVPVLPQMKKSTTARPKAKVWC
jgi:hypothetical protein